jgi:hypothetical protein
VEARSGGGPPLRHDAGSSSGLHLYSTHHVTGTPVGRSARAA